MRQQRATQNRRLLTRGNPARPQDIWWTPFTASGNQVTFILNTDASQITIQGIPKIQSIDVGLPTAFISLSGNELVLEYASTVPLPTTFIIGTGTLEMRTIWGGSLGATSQPMSSSPWPPYFPSNQPWNPVISGTQLQIYVTGGISPMLSDNIPQFYNETSGQYPTSWSVAGNVATFTYATPPNSGDVISVTDDESSDLIFIDGSRCVAQAVPCP
jgi:hypothetical protein